MLSADALYTALTPFFRQQAGRKLTVGLSGGLDSVVLLHLLAQARQTYALTLEAVHVHHGLNAAAASWVNFCAHYCRQLELPLHICRVRVDTDGGTGLEAAARAARYAAYRRHTDRIVLAHHRDDQSETFLLAALRGGGLRALAAMPPERSAGSLNILRPLLTVSRAELAAYAERHALSHIEDDSNRDTALLRNHIRHRLLPAAAERVPHVHRQLNAAVRQLQDELALLEELTAADWQSVCADGRFDCRIWQGFSPARRRNLLHRFAAVHRLGTPRRAATTAFADTLAAQPQGRAEWPLPYGRAVAARGILYPLPNGFADGFGWRHTVSGSLQHITAAVGILWQPQAFGLPPDRLQQHGSIRTADRHDRIAIRNGHKSLPDLLQEHGIPPPLRPYWPVLCAADGHVLAVVGLRTAHGCGTAGGLMPYAPALSPYLLPPV